MDIKINVQTGEACGFFIKDITEDYQKESGEQPDSLKYSDTVSVVILVLNKLKQED